jgi:hypothetical protein
MKLNEWEKKFPDPGAMPTPPTEFPTGQGIEAMRAWHEAQSAYDKWIRANRRFLIARACDLLEEKQAASLKATKGDHVKMDATEIICLVLGVSYLQGPSIGAPADLFSVLLGGSR